MIQRLRFLWNRLFKCSRYNHLPVRVGKGVMTAHPYELDYTGWCYHCGIDLGPEEFRFTPRSDSAHLPSHPERYLP